MSMSDTVSWPTFPNITARTYGMDRMSPVGHLSSNNMVVHLLLFPVIIYPTDCSLSVFISSAAHMTFLYFLRFLHVISGDALLFCASCTLCSSHKFNVNVSKLEW